MSIKSRVEYCISICTGKSLQPVIVLITMLSYRYKMLVFWSNMCHKMMVGSSTDNRLNRKWHVCIAIFDVNKLHGSELDLFSDTHRIISVWGFNKIINILQAAFSNSFSWMKIVVYWYRILFLIHIQYWVKWWFGTEPLTEPMMIQFVYAYMCHRA